MKLRIDEIIIVNSKFVWNGYSYLEVNNDKIDQVLIYLYQHPLKSILRRLEIYEINNNRSIKE